MIRAISESGAAGGFEVLAGGGQKQVERPVAAEERSPGPPAFEACLEGSQINEPALRARVGLHASSLNQWFSNFLKQ